ncbi:putative lipase [Encephalitozoon hellem]|nr:putative lipase [Encephalitozoon hellem]
MLLHFLQRSLYDAYGSARSTFHSFRQTLESDTASTDVVQEHVLGFMDRVHLMELIEMASNAYHSHDLDTVLARFGYDGDGVRAKAFRYNGRVVIAFKGTTLSVMGVGIGKTSRKDKLLDRILYSICKDKGCEEEKIREFESIGYFRDALKIVDSIKKMYHEDKPILVGHSLGGTIASLLGIRNNLPVIAFSSPGDAHIASILGLYDIARHYSNIVHVGMCNDVVFRGECSRPYSPCNILGYSIETRCHVGRSLCIQDGGWDSLIYHPIDVMKAKITLSEEIVLIEDNKNINCVY